jgi:uncharacterized membrane protein YidH (DUF202 family)
MSPVGLAAERTALAWRRTAIAAMVVAALLLDHAATNQWRPATIGPTAAALAMAVLAGVCFSRNRTLHQGHYGHGRSAIATAALVVVAVAAIAAVMALTDPAA